MRIISRSFANVASKSPAFIRKMLYKISGLCFNDSEIRGNVFFDSPKQVKIGRGCVINRGVEFYVGYTKDVSIELSENVYVGPNVLFCCVTHEIGSSEKRAGNNIYKSISVGKGVWIGANATILPGVHIGDGSIIAAGAVVVKDVEEDCMYAGVPARMIKQLEKTNPKKYKKTIDN